MSENERTPTVCARLKAVIAGGKGYGISHRWDGTVLTVTSDSGSSSADLVGPRGPAGDFSGMTEAEKQKFIEEFITYITQEGESSNITKEFIETIVEEITNYLKDEGSDGETVQQFFDELLEELNRYITENGDTINIGGKVYVAELRLENGVYISDKTFEDLKPHIAAGEVVVCDFFGADSRTRCHMTTCTDYSASFVMHSVLGADEYFTFTAEGVTHTVAESGGNSGENVTDYPPYVAVKKTDSTVTVHERRYDEIAEVWAEKVTTITLDENGWPDTVTRDDGTTTSLTWEGFDE